MTSCTPRRKTRIILHACCLLAICSVVITEQWTTAEDDDALVDKLVKRITASKWIVYFPYLRTSLNSWRKNLSESRTHPDKTQVEFDEDRIYRRGDILHGKITVFDKLGRRKQYGGDFFIVTIRRPISRFDGVACETTDNADGSYFFECFLPWRGPALLSVILVHPSEIVFELMKRYSSVENFGLYIYTKMYNSKKEEERTICSVAFPEKRSDQVCNYSNPTHGEKRTCLKPFSGECSEIVWQEAIQLRGPQTIYRDHLYFRVGYNFHVPIKRHSKKIYVEDRDYTPPDVLKRFGKLSTNPISPTGWFHNASWMSFKRKKHIRMEYNAISTCVRNKRMYFIGDSTIRMIYHHVLTILKLKDAGFDNTVEWSRGRDAEDDALNLTMHYRSHGPPLLIPGPEDSRPYISDSLDAITTGGNGTIVMLTLGYHFLSLTPDVFISRLRIIKSVIKDVMFRLPGIKIIVKGLHFHASEMRKHLWLTYRLEVLLRHELGFLPGVTFIECWDRTLVYNSKPLHPSGYILEQISSDIFGVIC